MAAVKGDPIELWNLFSVISNARSEITRECGTVCRMLGILRERLGVQKKKLLAEIERLETELAVMNAKMETAVEEGNSAAELEAMAETIRQRIRTLEDRIDEIKRNYRKADHYREQLETDKRRCLASMKRGGNRVSYYTSLLEKMLFEEDFQVYVASASEVIPGDHAGRYRMMSLRGIAFYCNDDELDPGLLDEKGRTNLVRMEKGMAPIGSDGFPVNLHHMQQSDAGAIIEMSRTMHFQNHKQLHINTHDIPSGINRSAFGALKRAYWKRRAAFIKRELGICGAVV